MREKINSLIKYTTIGFFIILTIIFSQHFISSVKADQVDNVYGWAWSEHLGWISLNCYNYYNSVLEDRCDQSSYGVNIEVDGSMTGYGWSEYYGWIDFSPQGPYPQDPQLSAQLERNGQIRGWVKLISFSDNGWFRLNGQTCSGSNCALTKNPGQQYQLDSSLQDGQSSYCLNCNEYKRTCNGGDRAGNICETDIDCTGDENDGTCNGAYIEAAGGTLLCNICFENTLPVECDGQTCEHNEKYPVGAMCGSDYSLPAEQEYLCSGCTQHITDNGEITVCNECPICYEYGLAVDYGTNRLVGWGWNSISDNTGLGWMQFGIEDLIQKGPWLETQKGGIYGIGNIGSEFTYETPDNSFNATYEIRSGGVITHINTQSDDIFVNEEYDNLIFPNQDTVYSNTLGRIDFSGIDAGQYGEIESIANSADIDAILGGKVYKSNGDLIISSAMEFDAGNTLKQDGSGLIIIDGDLFINSNITYESSQITNLKYLPSVAWIVKGDVFIHPNVSTVVGTFIVLGDGDDSCPDLNAVSGSCGRFSTGNSSNSLDVFGSVMARQFNLQRTYYSADRGAERIYYDGRSLANTPPALGDITQVLPTFSE